MRCGKLEAVIPTLEKLGLPPIFREVIKEKNGIALITGGTGSGKATTLAAMINELNQTQEIHIVTLEDRIEFLHQHKLAAISQRELGKDFRISPTVCGQPCGRLRKSFWWEKFAIA